MSGLGLGAGWRPETAALALQRDDLGFVEVVAESIRPRQPLPAGLELLRRRGTAVIPHGVSLGLGGGAPLHPGRLERLAALARRLESPLVSEHIAFVRAGGLNAGHLMPVPRTRSSLEVLVANIRQAQSALPVPLAVEPVASLMEWPEEGPDRVSEAEFITEIVERTECLLLLDLANLHTNSRNHGYDPIEFLDALPLDALGYVHVAGGIEHDGLWHDTHAHALWPEVAGLITELATRAPVPGMMLERDGDYPPLSELHAELDTIAAAWASGDQRRAGTPPRAARRRRRPLAYRAGPDEGVRRGLEESQHALLDALVGNGPVPDGFDHERVAAARRALQHKRLHEAQAAGPALAKALSQDYPRLFRTWAGRVPPKGGPGMDARAFARWLPPSRLTPAAAAELTRGELRIADRAGVRVRRAGPRGLPVISARLPRGRVITLGRRTGGR